MFHMHPIISLSGTSNHKDTHQKILLDNVKVVFNLILSLRKTYNSVSEKEHHSVCRENVMTHRIESSASLSHIHRAILCSFEISLGFNQRNLYILHFNIKKSSYIRIIKQKSLELPFVEICLKAKLLNFSTIRSFYIARENKRRQINFDLMPKANFKFWVSV